LKIHIITSISYVQTDGLEKRNLYTAIPG